MQFIHALLWQMFRYIAIKNVILPFPSYTGFIQSPDARHERPTYETQVKCSCSQNSISDSLRNPNGLQLLDISLIRHLQVMDLNDKGIQEKQKVRPPIGQKTADGKNKVAADCPVHLLLIMGSR